MRLIDANRLNEVIERNFCYPGCLKQIVDIQPTAYSVDKVVERLKSVSVPEDKVLYLDPDKFGVYVRLEDAIKIVKGD